MTAKRNTKKEKKKNNKGFPYKANRKILLTLLLCFMLVGAMGLVDAKKKTYDSLTQTVNLDSSFLGIKTGNIAEIKLNTPLNYEVGLGYQKVAEFEVQGFTDYSGWFKGMDFYNINKNMEEETIAYDFRMKVAYEVTLDKMVKNCDKMVIEELI
jgi:hypothetical protein